jgi:hypothetical protein
MRNRESSLELASSVDEKKALSKRKLEETAKIDLKKKKENKLYMRCLLSSLCKYAV